MKHRKKLVLFTLVVMNLVEQPAPEVHIEQGILSGKISMDGSFLEYLGIPYATTAGRFKVRLSTNYLCFTVRYQNVISDY